MTLAQNATMPSGNTANLVADYVQFVKEISNQELNSVLEYQVDLWLRNSSAPAWWPLKNDSLPRSSIVNVIDASSPNLIIGGHFNTTNYTNIVQYNYSVAKMIPFAAVGLSGQVNTMLLRGSQLYVGGNFGSLANSSQPNISNIAMYDLETGSWNSMQQGVSGPVGSLVTFTAPNSTSAWLSISGNFSSTGLTNTSSGTQMYDLSLNKWVSNGPFISGPVISAFSIPNITILAGNIKGAESYQTNALSVVGNQNQFYQIPLFPTNTDYRTNAGMYWTNPNTGNSTMIVGGRFQLPNGAQNIAMLSNGSWSGFPITNWEGQVTTLTVAEDNLYMGGDFTAITNGQNLTALAVWNLVNHTHLPVQDLQSMLCAVVRFSLHVLIDLLPADDDGSLPIVNIVRKKPDGSGILVGGKFSHAGSLPCASLCLLDTSNLQWSNIGGNISGEITDFDFVSVSDFNHKLMYGKKNSY